MPDILQTHTATDEYSDELSQFEAAGQEQFEAAGQEASSPTPVLL